ENGEVRFGLEGKDRYVHVGTDGRGTRHGDVRRRYGDAYPAAAVDEEAVVDVRDRVDRVDVVHEPEGRLRLPDRDHALRLEVAERVRPGWRTDRLRGLREHVVREAIAGMMERPVAGGIHRLERQADAEPHDSAAPLDADALRRARHPRGSLGG